MKLRALCTVLCTVLFHSLFAQIPGMKIYTESEGYTATTGYLISQDSAGFIWTGSDRGAIRFDGEKFTVFDERSGLRNKEIMEIIPAPDHTVLFNPLLNNLAYYKKGKVITEKQDKRLGQTSNIGQNFAAADPVTGNIWISDGQSQGSIHCFRRDSLTEIPLNIEEFFQVRQAFGNRLFLMLGTKQYPAFYDVKEHSLQRLKMIPGPGPETMIESLFDREQQYMVSTTFFNHDILLFRLKNKELHLKASFPYDKPIRQIIIDRNNHLWVVNQPTGMSYWGPVSRLTTNSSPLEFFPGTAINYLYVDRDNNVWFTTENQGLHFISYKHWQNALLKEQLKLSGKIPTNIAGDGRNIYLTYKGDSLLKILHRGKTHDIIVKTTARGIVDMAYLEGKLYLVEGSRVNSIEFDKDFNVAHQKNIPVPGFIKDMVIYGKQNLLLATHNGAYILRNTKGDLDTLFSGRSTAVSLLSHNRVLIGTPHGLYQWIPIAKKAVKVEDATLQGAHITDLTQTGNGRVLIGTAADGLYSYDYRRERFLKIKLNMEVQTGMIRQIFRENDQYLWLATDQGIFKFRYTSGPGLKKISHYTFVNGLPSNSVSDLYVQNDTAYAITSAGLTILPPEKYPGSPSATKKLCVHWTKTGDSLQFFPRDIELYHQNHLSLELSSFSYESLGNITYRYILEGLHSHWLESRTSEIHLNNLPPGSYIFKATAINAKGNVSHASVQLPVIVHPEVWQTWWFRSIAILLLLFILSAGIYYILLRHRIRIFRQIQQKKKLAQLELEAIKAQINPHFIYNCLNSIQYFTYKKEYENSRSYLDLFALLLRQTMKLSQETFTTIEEETEYLLNYLKLEKMRFKDKITFHITIEDGLDKSRMLPAMLLQPFVENALKHGISHLKQDDGQIVINFRQTEKNWLQITIEDNGPGWQPAPEKKAGSLGLRLSGNRANAYNQLFQLGIKVKIRKGKGLSKALPGTLIELLIPPISYESTRI